MNTTNKQKLVIWGREFELDIEFDCCEDEEILPVQKEALKAFLSCENLIDNSLEKVKEYCIDRDEEKFEGAIENIFKYVIPHAVYVQRNPENEHVAGLICRYKFDPEHGLAVVFRNEQFDDIGGEGIIL
jgi:hypothetical protein